MEYEVWDVECDCGNEAMVYSGSGNYYCPFCGARYHDDDYDEEHEEALSVSDAADIWMSSGKDEDYMFGYTEEELEDALR